MRRVELRLELTRSCHDVRFSFGVSLSELFLMLEPLLSELYFQSVKAVQHGSDFLLVLLQQVMLQFHELSVFSLDELQRCVLLGKS